MTHPDDAEPDLARGGRWAQPPDKHSGQDLPEPSRGRIYGAPGGTSSVDETSSLLPVLYVPPGAADSSGELAAERRGERAAEIVYRRRLARLTLVCGGLIAVLVVAVSLVLQAAAPNRDSTITGPANRVPAWVYAPGDGPSSESPAASPTGEEPPEPTTPEPPPPGYPPQGGTGTGQPQPTTSPPTSGVPTPEPAALRDGVSRSLRLASTDRYVRHRNGLVFLDKITTASPAGAHQQATFAVVRGLADRNCYSFRGADGRYLRHFSFRIRYDADDRSDIFRRDATFCPRAMSRDSSVVVLESSNYRGRFIRDRGGELGLDEFRNSPDFAASILFQSTTPWSN